MMMSPLTMMNRVKAMMMMKAKKTSKVKKIVKINKVIKIMITKRYNLRLHTKVMKSSFRSNHPTWWTRCCLTLNKLQRSKQSKRCFSHSLERGRVRSNRRVRMETNGQLGMVGS
jgi:hypothetical protein